MIALAVPGLNEELFDVSAPQSVEGGINPAWHCVRIARDGPQGQPVQEMRFQVSFQEASSLSRRVPAFRFQFWMGRLRELVTTGPLPQLVEQIATGRWGLVTNWADVQVVGEVTANDVIHARFWTMPAQRAEVEFCCDFWKWLPDEQFERIAVGRQKATWVRIVGHGQVVAEDLPDYLLNYIEQMGPRTPHAASQATWPASLAHFQQQTGSSADRKAGRNHRVLARDTIQTTLAEANLVGNVYFANYFTWQERSARPLPA